MKTKNAHRKDGTFRRGHKAASKGEPRKMWSGRLPERTHEKLRALTNAEVFGSQADAIAAAVDALPSANKADSTTCTLWIVDGSRIVRETFENARFFN